MSLTDRLAVARRERSGTLPTASGPAALGDQDATGELKAKTARLQWKPSLGMLVTQKAFFLGSRDQLAINKQGRGCIMANGARKSENNHVSVTRWLSCMASLNSASISGHCRAAS